MRTSRREAACAWAPRTQRALRDACVAGDGGAVATQIGVALEGVGCDGRRRASGLPTPVAAVLGARDDDADDGGARASLPCDTPAARRAALQVLAIVATAHAADASRWRARLTDRPAALRALADAAAAGGGAADGASRADTRRALRAAALRPHGCLERRGA